MRKALTVVGERMILELRGLSCLPLELVPARRKCCAVTRFFSGRVSDRATMEEAVAAHAARLGEKLRRDWLGTDQVTVFYNTSEHDRGDPMSAVSTVVTLPEATNDTSGRAGRNLPQSDQPPSNEIDAPVTNTPWSEYIHALAEAQPASGFFRCALQPDEGLSVNDAALRQAHMG